MRHKVASMPAVPPLTKSLTIERSPEAAGLGFFSSPMDN